MAKRKTRRQKYLEKYKPEPVLHDVSLAEVAYLGSRGWAYCTGCGAILSMVYSKGLEFLPLKNTEEGHCNPCLRPSGHTRLNGAKFRRPVFGFWSLGLYPYVAGGLLTRWTKDRPFRSDGRHSPSQGTTIKGQEVRLLIILRYEEGAAVLKALDTLSKEFHPDNHRESSQYVLLLNNLMSEVMAPHQASGDPYDLSEKADSVGTWL